VHITLGQRHVLLGLRGLASAQHTIVLLAGAHLQVVFARVRVAAADTLHGAAVGLDVNHVTDLDLFTEACASSQATTVAKHVTSGPSLLFLQGVVDAGVELELLCSFHGSQADDDVVDNLVKAANLRAKGRWLN
jgi:hypothetical protein